MVALETERLVSGLREVRTLLDAGLVKHDDYEKSVGS